MIEKQWKMGWRYDQQSKDIEMKINTKLIWAKHYKQFNDSIM